jgi:hypothetical protein
VKPAVIGSARFADDALGRSTLAEIQRKVIENGKRKTVSRLLHAKNDKESIAAWKSDLTRIVHIFNVCFLVFARLSLNARFQTELAINTHATVSGMRHDVVTTRTVVSNVRNDVASTHAIVSDMHYIMTKSQGADGNNRSVSTICTMFTAE